MHADHSATIRVLPRSSAVPVIFFRPSWRSWRPWRFKPSVSPFIHPLHRALVCFASSFIEAAEDDAIELRIDFEEAERLIRRDRGGAVEGEAIDAGADRRERDAADVRAQG